MLAGQPAAGHRRRCHQPGPHQTHRTLSFGQQPLGTSGPGSWPTPTPLTACHCAKAQPAGGPRLPADSEPTHPHPPAAPRGAIIASVHPVAAILSLRHLGFLAGGSCRPVAWLGGMDWPHSLVRGAPFSVAVLSPLINGCLCLAWNLQGPALSSPSGPERNRAWSQPAVMA